MDPLVDPFKDPLGIFLKKWSWKIWTLPKGSRDEGLGFRG